MPKASPLSGSWSSLQASGDPASMPGSVEPRQGGRGAFWGRLPALRVPLQARAPVSPSPSLSHPGLPPCPHDSWWSRALVSNRKEGGKKKGLSVLRFLPAKVNGQWPWMCHRPACLSPTIPFLSDTSRQASNEKSETGLQEQTRPNKCYEKPLRAFRGQ